MTDFSRPDWTPKVADSKRVLITGASGGLGGALVTMLLEGSDCVIGAHGASKKPEASEDRIIPIQRSFDDEADCFHLAVNLPRFGIVRSTLTHDVGESTGMC